LGASESLERIVWPHPAVAQSHSDGGDLQDQELRPQPSRSQLPEDVAMISDLIGVVATHHRRKILGRFLIAS
jgi:hypothetical protein